MNGGRPAMDDADRKMLTRIDDRLKDLAKKMCKSIGCSGVNPDLCRNHSQNCKIVRKIIGYKDASHEHTIPLL